MLIKSYKVTFLNRFDQFMKEYKFFAFKTLRNSILLNFIILWCYYFLSLLLCLIAMSNILYKYEIR